MQVDTDPDPPEERTFDFVVLSGRSEKLQVKDVWHSTDSDSLLVEVGILASTKCLASGKDMRFPTWTR